VTRLESRSAISGLETDFAGGTHDIVRETCMLCGTIIQKCISAVVVADALLVLVNVEIMSAR